jgi:glycosyltransferase involved in cell wall biosynthesis
MQMVSLVVLTFNEEVNLGHCLESVAGLAERIFVVDSFSTDGTLKVAEAFGAHIVQRPFVHQGEQLNWALENLPLDTPWILRLDADEYLTTELREEIQAVLPALPPDITGLYIKRRFYFMGRWIRHGGYYPTWLLRLFRQGMARCESRWMDENLVLVQGRSMKLTHDIVDHNQKGLAFWCQRQLGYAFREARDLLSPVPGQAFQLPPRFWGPPESRKRWCKNYLYLRFPLFFRACVYFLYRYVVLLGFLDGFPGLIFHFLHAFWYRFLVDALLYQARSELRSRSRLTSDPTGVHAAILPRR